MIRNDYEIFTVKVIFEKFNGPNYPDYFNFIYSIEFFAGV